MITFVVIVIWAGASGITVWLLAAYLTSRYGSYSRPRNPKEGHCHLCRGKAFYPPGLQGGLCSDCAQAQSEDYTHDYHHDRSVHYNGTGGRRRH